MELFSEEFLEDIQVIISLEINIVLQSVENPDYLVQHLTYGHLDT